MRRVSVPMTTWANSSVIVEVPDDVTDPEAIAELARVKFHEDSPTLCNGCTGGHSQGAPELEIGDEWDIPLDDHGNPSITFLDD